MRARYPDREGYAEHEGVRIFWEEYGAGDRTVVFIPPWQIVHSRIWKMQLAYFARYFRVVTFDAPGNGRSDRPASGYEYDTEVARTLAVMDATGTFTASLVTLSRSTLIGALLATRFPERVDRLILTDAALRIAPRRRNVRERQPHYEGWDKWNIHY